MMSLQRTMTVALLLVGHRLSANAQTTAFTYHGQLVENGTPATGLYDLLFKIYDAEIAELRQELADLGVRVQALAGQIADR